MRTNFLLVRKAKASVRANTGKLQATNTSLQKNHWGIHGWGFEDQGPNSTPSPQG